MAMRWSPRVSGALGSAVALGLVEGLPAEHRARVLEVTVAPPVPRRAEDDVVADGLGRRHRMLEETHDVALAAPDGEIAGGQRPVLGMNAADAHADDGQPMRV